jgi:hypothetical protein
MAIWEGWISGCHGSGRTKRRCSLEKEERKLEGADLSYEDPTERQQHRHTIQTIAKDAGYSEEEIGGLYESVLQELKARSRIKGFLAVFANRRVRELIREKRQPALDIRPQ